MKAAVYTRYGPPNVVVQIADVEMPVPKDNEVLIQVRAASVNPLDWHFMRGTPYFVRIMTGLRKPKITRLGVDVAGQVGWREHNAVQTRRRGVRLVPGGLCRICVCSRVGIGHEAQ